MRQTQNVVNNHSRFRSQSQTYSEPDAIDSVIIQILLGKSRRGRELEKTTHETQNFSHLPRLHAFQLAGILRSQSWIWSFALLLMSTLFLPAASVCLSRSLPKALDAAAVAALLLVMIGFYNAWNVTLYLASRTPS